MSNTSKIRYKRPRSDDPYLIYDSSIEEYYEKMASFIIPFDDLNLCKHLTNFCKFIDALYKQEAIVKKISFIQKDEGDKRKLNEDMENDHLWFLKHDMDEEDQGKHEEVEEMNIEGKKEEISLEVYSKSCHLAWEWHDNIKARKSTFTSLYAMNYFLSWGSFCRSYYINMIVKSGDEIHSKRATDFNFVDMVDKTHYIVVHDDPIMSYSLKFIFEAIKVLIPVLYSYTFSVDMKEYLYHLFLRYCSILSVSCINEDDELRLLDHPARFKYHGSEDEDEEERGGKGGEEDFNEYKKRCIKMNDNYSITSDYIYEGEALFYSQLSRMNQSVVLMKKAVDSPIKFNEYRTQKESLLLIKMCLDEWNKFIHDLSLHKLLGTSVKEGFHSSVMHLFLYHGEKGRYIINWPESNNEPGDIISQTRPDDFTLLQKVRQFVIKDISILFYKGFIQFLNNTTTTTTQTTTNELSNSTIRSISEDNGISRVKRIDEYTPKTIDSTNMFNSNNNNNVVDNGINIPSNGDRIIGVPYIEHEKECVLASKVCILNWLRYNVVDSWKLINESFIIEELCDNMTPIDNIFIDHQRIRSHKLKHPPYLVRLMRIYYVIDINHDEMQIYHTDVLPKAYFIWLSLLRKYNYIKEFSLKEPYDIKIQSYLSKMITVISSKLQ